MHMGNGKRSGSGGRKDWPVLVSGAVGVAVFGAVALFVVKPLIDLPSLLGPILGGLIVGTILFAAMILVGLFLGQFVGRLLFPPPSGDPPAPPPRA
jgi:hypothetical protein